MASEDDGQSERRDDENSERPDEELSLDEALSEIEDVESRRRKIAVAFGIGAAVLAAAAFYMVYAFQTELFRPDIPVEEGEKEIVAETDDPQCRKLIAQVTDVGDSFFELESEIEENLLADDVDEVQRVIERIQGLRDRLRENESMADEANLRFEESREELEQWFEYVHNELALLQEVGRNRIETLRAESRRDAGDDSRDAGRADAGESAGGDASDAGEPTGSERPPRERRDGAVVALHDAFQNFRVWHSGSLHPCGDNAEDEEPWRPEDGSAQGTGQNPSRQIKDADAGQPKLK